MEGQLAVPFHFASEFLILAVAVGGAFEGLRKWRGGAGRWAAGQALGFTALVAAEVLHGSLVVSSDGALSLVVLRSISFGLIALAARPNAVLVAPAIFVAGPDASYAFIPAVLAAAVTVRGAVAYRDSRHPATRAFFAAFGCFAAGEVALVAAEPGGGGALVAYHALRALGALLLSRWLWTSAVRRVRLRFVAAFVAALLILILVISAALSAVIGNNLEDEELRRVQVAGEAQNGAFENLTRSAISAAGLLAGRLGDSPALAALFQTPGAKLDAAARDLFRLFPQFDLIMFVDLRAAILGFAQAPRQGVGLSEDARLSIAGSDEVNDALAEPPRSFASLDSAGASDVVIIGAAPVVDRRRAPVRIVGGVVTGYRIDSTYLEGAAREAAATLTVLRGREPVATTFDCAPRGLTAGALRDRIRSRVEESRLDLLTSGTVCGRRYFSAYLPLQRPDQELIGVLAVSRPATGLAGAQRDINRTLFLIAILASALAGGLAWAAGGRVTRPIRSLTGAAEALRRGDLAARARVSSADEVGALGEAFNQMAGSLQKMTGDLRSAATEEATLRARMEAIMQSMGDGLVATDSAGHVTAFNRAAEEITGLRAAGAFGARLAEVLVGRDGSGRALAESLRREAVPPGAVLARSDGRTVPIALVATPLRDGSGEEVGRVLVFRDISAELETERMKSEFLANVSHELRTPLTPIRGYAEILKRKKVPFGKAEPFIDGILESTSRLERIVEILVDFAALEAGRLKPRTEPIDLRTFVDAQLERWRHRDEGHRFVRKIALDLPPVEADRRLLSKCIDELIDNAVKFSPKGGKVEIAAQALSGDGKRSARQALVRIQVRDEGIGIAPEQVQSLFQDFRQLDGSATRAYGGLGLGLAYAKRIAEAHRGEITVRSAPGRGSTFSLDLPRADAPTKRTAPRSRVT
jgi:PAS domain S-box-containing protein